MTIKFTGGDNKVYTILGRPPSMPPLKKEFKKAWLAALRSGDYVQGVGRLATTGKDFDTFCCLGVGCDVYAYEHDLFWKFQRNSRTVLQFEGGTGLPTREIISDWFDDPLGMTTYTPYLRFEGMAEGGDHVEVYELDYLNDYHRLDFKQLSNLIEAFY